MSNLLKDAIADAKAVRETALQNAKAVLEEAFTPKLQSMLSQKLQQEMADEEADQYGIEELNRADSGQNNYMGAKEGSDVVDVMEGEAGLKAASHTVDPQGASNELSAGPSDQDTDTTSTVNTSVEGPKAGGNLTTSSTDKSGLDGGKSQITLSDQDTDQTPNNDTSSELKISEGEESDEDDELNEIIAELEGELEGGFGEEEETFGGEGEIDGLGGGLGGEIEGLGAVDGLGGEEEIGAGLGNEFGGVEGEESPAEEIPVAGDEVAGDIGDEEIDLDEILREMELSESCDGDDTDEDEEDDDKEELTNEVVSLREENNEYKKALTIVRGKLHEVNLLNSKLLFTNKVFKTFGLNNDQKMKVVVSFDRASNVSEVKLTYTNLCESFKIVNVGRRNKNPITEGASKVIKSTKPRAETVAKAQPQILSEGAEFAARFQKLAGIKK